jgi:hypothetical protein
MTQETLPATTPPRAKSFPWFAYTLLALVGIASAVAGTLLLNRHDNDNFGTVNEIRITAKPGIDLRKIEEVLDTPDYYIEIATEQGKTQSETYKDTRVGNGLTFHLPIAVRLGDIKEIRLCDQNVMKDSLVDRVDRVGRTTLGERFQFELLGAEPPQPLHRVGVALAIGGGILLLIVLVRFIWYQVI